MKTSLVIGALALVSAAQSSQAVVIEYMPPYADIVLGDGLSNPAPPDGMWYMDRTPPAGFATESMFQERTDVLKISILGSDKAGLTDFSSLQGREYSFENPGQPGQIGQPGSWTLSADLFVENGWASSSNGLRRAELWGVSLNTQGNSAGLPAIGFTNEGSGIGRFRFATGNWTETWFDLAAPVNYGAWNSLQIEFDPTADLFKYYVNGDLQASFTSIVPVPNFGVDLGGQSIGIFSTIMQTYNYGDDYMVRWSNTAASNTAATPEPGSAALLALGGLAVLLRTRRKRSLIGNLIPCGPPMQCG